MPLLNDQRLRTRARSATAYKSAAAIFSEQVRSQEALKQPDIFLSHSFDDRELLLGAILTIEDLDYSVYVDWRDDPTLDRTKVTPATAAILRERMAASRCLFYAVTPNVTDSLWTKWELGYKDGKSGRIAILPIVGSSTEAYNGPQFLGLYPYASIGTDTNKNRKIWINRSSSCYVEFSSWLTGSNPVEHS